MEVRSRSRTEKTIQILEVVNGYHDDDNNNNNNNEGITQATLMSKLFLGYEQMKEYLMRLIEDDLLSYDTTMSTFKITEKGRTFLQAYNQIDQILKEHKI
jgi:predicted transcriptional regulator